ncbi:hypothetical protein RYX36_034015 [Vicia faba]
MLEIDADEWYMKYMAFPPNLDTVLLNTVDSITSSSCSPSSSVFNALDPSLSNLQYLLHQNHKPVDTLSYLLNKPFEIPYEFGFLEPQGSSLPHSSKMGGLVDFTATKMMSFPHLPQTSNRSKVLRLLDSLPPSGTQPTLFQKRATLRKNMGKGKIGEGSDKKRKFSGGDEIGDLSSNWSGLNYDSDDLTESNGKNFGNASNRNNTVSDQKGKNMGDSVLIFIEKEEVWFN